MYLQFYGLREAPFANVCDERYFYESPRHAEALGRMLYTVEQRRGLVLVTGEIGTGKTFLSQVLAARLGRRCQTLLLRHPSDTPKQVVRSVSQLMGLPVSPDADKIMMVDAIERHLAGSGAGGRLCALIFDEAQCLSDGALEEIRLLWNMEARGQRLFQMVLMGHPEFRERLGRPQMAALKQRVAMSYHLGPLTAEETTAYIMHRRRVARDEGCTLQFTPNALAEIYRLTGGVPRLINALCDKALLAGYARGKPVIKSKTVRLAADEKAALVSRLPQPAAREATPVSPTIPLAALAARAYTTARRRPGDRPQKAPRKRGG